MSKNRVLIPFTYTGEEDRRERFFGVAYWGSARMLLRGFCNLCCEVSWLWFMKLAFFTYYREVNRPVTTGFRKLKMSTQANADMGNEVHFPLLQFILVSEKYKCLICSKLPLLAG
jgi:hypothetical protein